MPTGHRINALLTGIASELQINLFDDRGQPPGGRDDKRGGAGPPMFQKAMSEGRIPKYIDDSLLIVKDPRGIPSARKSSGKCTGLYGIRITYFCL